MHSVRSETTHPALWLLLVGWVAYSAGVLGWWAYTEPNADICIAPARIDR